MRPLPDLSTRRERWNRCRFSPGTSTGHYESYFQRANHPTRPLAFWIRYTIFSPAQRPANALGELWAIYFDGEAEQITAVRQEVPLDRCSFSASGLSVQIDAATLDATCLDGSAQSAEHKLEWSLRYQGEQRPLLLLPEPLYSRRLPRAKALVGTPNAVYDGSLDVDGLRIEIEGWVGSQNHNWGSRHTDEYAWGQVAGFENEPDAFLECATSRIRLGPFWTPWLTPIVLRLDGQEFSANSIGQALRAYGRFTYFDWHFASRTREAKIRGRIQAPGSAFVGLRYLNPPGGVKTCLNSKLARCEITLERLGQPPRRLHTAHRAAFEILTNDIHHGVPIVA